MPRKRMKEKEFCCACLSDSSDVELVKLMSKDENQVDLLTKLCTSVPQIEWQPSFHICLFCTDLLDTVYTFHNTCLKSDQIRKGQLLNNKKPNTRYKRQVNKDKHEGKRENLNKIKIENKAEQNPDNEEIKSIKNAREENNTNVKNEEKIKDNNSDVDDFLDNYSGDTGQDETDENQQANTVKSMKKKSGLLEVRKIKKRYRKRGSYEFKCEQCDFWSSSSTYLVDHCVTEHAMNQRDVKPFSCNRCPSKFTNSSNLMQHQKYHEAVRSNVCSYCGKGFITKTDLTTHEKHHLNKREYHCDECGKSFNTHKDVRSHKLVVHTDPKEWKHVCDVCDKRFPIKSNYDSHMRRHAGEKNFECYLCNRKFTDKCVLQRHMKTHSNIRDHRCPECSKEYKDHRVMRIHMAKIHNIGVGEITLPTKERKHQCHICPKAYYAKNKLTRHLYVHSGEKPYSCSICAKKFNDKGYVKQHLKKTHGVENDVGDNIKWEIDQT